MLLTRSIYSSKARAESQSFNYRLINGYQGIKNRRDTSGGRANHQLRYVIATAMLSTNDILCH
jgi:hypothetical protein